MKWLKNYKLFESLDHFSILSDIMDILSELSDEGWRISKYNDNPKDIPHLKNNLSGINIYIDKNIIKSGELIKIEELDNIKETLLRLSDFLQGYNIETTFEIKKRNLSDAKKISLDDLNSLDYDIPWIKIGFNIK
jgi:hypothetical protein